MTRIDRSGRSAAGTTDHFRVHRFHLACVLQVQAVEVHHRLGARLGTLWTAPAADLPGRSTVRGPVHDASQTCPAHDSAHAPITRTDSGDGGIGGTQRSSQERSTAVSVRSQPLRVEAQFGQGAARRRRAERSGVEGFDGRCRRCGRRVEGQKGDPASRSRRSNGIGRGGQGKADHAEVRLGCRNCDIGRGGGQTSVLPGCLEDCRTGEARKRRRHQQTKIRPGGQRSEKGRRRSPSRASEGRTGSLGLRPGGRGGDQRGCRE